MPTTGPFSVTPMHLTPRYPPCDGRNFWNLSARDPGLSLDPHLGQGRADMQFRWLFWIAVVAGASYFPATWVLPDGAGLTAWKGLGVGLLALWAALNARSASGWAIAAVLALGATGDVLLDAMGLTVGAVAFLAGHLLAAGFYWVWRRPDLRGAAPIAIGRLVLIPAIAWFLPADRAAAPGIALYASGLALMAAAAWVSRFPRLLVSRGALFFAASDLLIFARMGPLAHSAAPDLLVWPLYFGGQAMIAWGVVAYLRRGAGTG